MSPKASFIKGLPNDIGRLFCPLLLKRLLPLCAVWIAVYLDRCDQLAAWLVHYLVAVPACFYCVWHGSTPVLVAVVRLIVGRRIGRDNTCRLTLRR